MQTKNTNTIAVDAKTANELTVHTGEDAWRLLSEYAFLTNWDALYKTCPWATVFQSRSFVITWYQIYRDKYSPIIVQSVQNNKLIGLLTLAVHSSYNKSVSIMGAGHYESYYHVWLTETSNGESFIKAAIKEVQQQFPRSHIHLRYISLQTPLLWINEPYWKSRIVVQSYSRPLIDMNQPDFSKMFHKTEFRNKLNRLKRLGELTFEHINNKEQFSALLNELIIQYNFRQGAMFNHNQFTEEPLKASFLLALFEKNLLHVSVMKVNKQFFASIVAVAERNWVHLAGINVHTPFHARYYSPGFVHFILLGQQLAKEGFTMFDLTPGGDFYKERLANRHDEVLEVVISSSLTFRIKRILRKQFYIRLAKAGKWPLGVELTLKKRFYILKGRASKIRKQGILNTLSEAAKHIIKPSKVRVYISISTFQDENAKLLYSKNSLNDLLQYEAEGSWMTRWEFLEDAMHRLGVGQTAYTFSEAGRLLACVWLSHDKGVTQQEAFTNKIIPPEAVLLQGFYCHPLGQNKLQDFILAVASEATKEAPTGPIYALTNSRESLLCRVLEVSGFRKVEQATSGL